ncbi:CPBP family intramembrane glutamic endopeptidase [Arthrobacter sp.]|uniref:CPBP family intramembrane glutamic endopeptidase n=1 Tax=Arthrobacter sp. TaxID=1667 RepID=UPI00289EAEBA|nr:CPBP family intramembrane glutamic endopeptidase [Arthrobacter sp.]
MTVVSAKDARVAPRVWIGLVIWAGYLGLIYVVQALSGIPYDTWGDSAGNLFLGAGLSLIIATILLALTTTLLGWWRPALYDRNRSRHRWPIFIPILFAVAAAMNLAGTDWSSYSGAFLAASLTLALVGFTEEIVNRGLLLVGFRTRVSEGWVWFLTSALFGLSHFVNVALGADAAGTVQQVFFAFLAGTVFYILRRTTGSLWAAMLLHGLWDFSVFAAGVGTPSDIAYVANVVEPLAGLLGLACVVFVIRGSKERIPGN